MQWPLCYGKQYQALISQGYVLKSLQLSLKVLKVEEYMVLKYENRKKWGIK